MPLICQCGCGQEIPPRPYHKRYKPKYIQSHFLRISQERRTERIRQVKMAGRTKPPADWVVPSGICECGCSQPTAIAKVTNRKRDQYAGYPMRYVRGHSQSGCARGTTHNSWKGGRTYHKSGYVMLYKPDHHGVNSNGYVPEHRYVYETSRGVKLPSNVHVHHINGIRDDNRPENLIATTRSEHKRVHQMSGAVIALFLDDCLLEAVREYVRRHGELPDLAELTQRLYGQLSSRLC